jgi:hypothetical protein
MENLEIYKTDSLDFKLKRKGDLLYYEGPLVSHFVNAEHPTQHCTNGAISIPIVIDGLFLKSLLMLCLTF